MKQNVYTTIRGDLKLGGSSPSACGNICRSNSLGLVAIMDTVIPYYKIFVGRFPLDLALECQKLRHFYFKKGDQPREDYVIFSANTRSMILADATKGRFTPALRQMVLDAGENFLSIDAADKIKSRVFYSLESYLHDPPPIHVMDEISLYLFGYSELVVEYLGRRPFADEEPDARLVNELDVSTPFTLDRPGGARAYLWRPSSLPKLKEEGVPEQHYANVRNWMLDPDAEVVLCLGGGGLRMLCLPSFFKILDYLNVREGIKEIWGCSMGAIVGYAYSIGVEPQVIERLSYGYYNDHFTNNTENLSTGKFLWGLAKRLFSRPIGEDLGLSEVQASLMAILEKARADTTPRLKPLPFIAVATNVPQKKVFGLALNHEAPKESADFIRNCDPMMGLSASSAVPLIFNPQRIPAESGNLGDELWLDGALGEEVPISLAYQAWRRRQALGVKRRLKILFVESGSELSKINIFARMEKFLHPLRAIALPWRLADIMYESRFANLQRLIGDDPLVEIKGIRLNFPTIPTMDPRMIPDIIRYGRSTIIKGMSTINSGLEAPRQLQTENTSA